MCNSPWDGRLKFMLSILYTLGNFPFKIQSPLYWEEQEILKRVCKITKVVITWKGLAGERISSAG